MHTIKIAGKSLSYEAIMYPDGRTEGDMMPILYDTATISLADATARYILCYKRSKNLFGKELRYADLVHELTGETYSFQVSNIFFLKVVAGDPRLLGRVGDELRLYENFGKTEHAIESDGDKPELVPLGYYDMFVGYTDRGYYPIFLSGATPAGIVEEFSDYYGYRAYEDASGVGHLILLVADMASTDEHPIWYFLDNFRKVSGVIAFDDAEEEIDTWDMGADDTITMHTTAGRTYELAGGTIRPKIFENTAVFTFTRYIEDTDSDIIVGKNTKGYFIIERDITEISADKQSRITYYAACLAVRKDAHYPLFVMRNGAGETVVVNRTGDTILTTDITADASVESVTTEGDDMVLIQVARETIPRKYLL